MSCCEHAAQEGAQKQKEGPGAEAEAHWEQRFIIFHIIIIMNSLQIIEIILPIKIIPVKIPLNNHKPIEEVAKITTKNAEQLFGI